MSAEPGALHYIGSGKARLQAAWTAALVNLNPIGQRLAAGVDPVVVDS